MAAELRCRSPRGRACMRGGGPPVAAGSSRSSASADQSRPGDYRPVTPREAPGTNLSPKWDENRGGPFVVGATNRCAESVTRQAAKGSSGSCMIIRQGDTAWNLFLPVAQEADYCYAHRCRDRVPFSISLRAGRWAAIRGVEPAYHRVGYGGAPRGLTAQRLAE